jgi:small subunit ribosomal protein S16
MVRIRLRRVGGKKQPSYRIVAADKESPRDGRFLENLGYYNPRTEPATLRMKEDRIYDWMSKGAQPSDSVKQLFNSAGLMDRYQRFKAGESLEGLLQEAAAAEEERSGSLKTTGATPAKKEKPQPKEEPKAEEKAEKKPVEEPEAETEPVGEPEEEKAEEPEAEMEDKAETEEESEAKPDEAVEVVQEVESESETQEDAEAETAEEESEADAGEEEEAEEEEAEEEEAEEEEAEEEAEEEE